MKDELRNIRDNIYYSVREEILGPGSEQTGLPIEEEIITDKPSKRYSTGILFTKKEQENINVDEGSSSDKDAENENNQEGKDEELVVNPKSECLEETIDEDFSENINNSHIIKKSSMGMTFFCDKNIEKLLIYVNGARYREVKTSECMIAYSGDLLPLKEAEVGSYVSYEEGFLKLKNRFDTKVINKFDENGYFVDRENLKDAFYKLAKQGNTYNKAYKRVPINFTNPIEVSFDRGNYGFFEIKEEQLEVFVLKREYYKKYSITVMLVNKNSSKNSDENYIFQPEIIVNSEDNNFRFLSSNISENNEDKLLKLLYRNKQSYGSGHGVSIDFSKIDTKTGIGKIKTDYMPIYEVPSTDFNMKEIKSIQDLVLPMLNLSTLSDFNKDKIMDLLNGFIKSYKEWIDKKGTEIENKSFDNMFKEVAGENIKNCKISYDRMKEGLNLLINNANAYKSFQLANTAMLIQRIQSYHPNDLEKCNSIDMYKKYDIKEAKWRGFQLAFLLMTIPSLVDDKNEYRDVVDLIWIPTGGGKTEAYLGVSAFTIFYRKITKGKSAGGTTIIMRYTLRLLAAQQFERASILICACEYLREKDEELLGDEPISIGLWIGSSQTPNTLKDARYEKTELSKNQYAENKFQLRECPWCKTKFTISSYNVSTRGNKTFEFDCQNHNCHFKVKGRLPIQIIDESLYKKPPTLLFSTVDKFAMLAWKGEIASFFGLASDNASPELIIQDELHLISGPLGTLVGLFETAIDYLCSQNGIKPKIIASTATICEADEQIKNVYKRAVKQFPSPGLEIEDSFFTRESNLEDNFGRLYVGLTGIGQTQITTEIRTFASILQKIEMMNMSDEEKDKYWTLVSYFNSIRELGKASTIIYDDVKDYMIRMARRIKDSRITRKISSARELTSRISSSEIVKTLKDLETHYPSKEAINILLATNMISVGVDVPRLNIMAIIGQPKLTSEYIQASSRVGRSDPGIVFTLYDGRKSRDDSHYEIFQAYHQAFYKYVEPTSITPYSEAAIDRMLHSMFISMIRHSTSLNSDDFAMNFEIEDNDVEKIKNYIINRAEEIEPTSVEYIKDKLNKIIENWIDKSQNKEYPLKYVKGENPLISAFYDKSAKHPGIETMTSMRNVDGEAGIRILEKRGDESNE
ncbi:DNA helicase [Clostridium gelidum]|uniref:DNA helicase n=1 Tax=Clostridium gelidum TaxID=704125 RepID=A0ABM7T4P2_9CLOT|nr:helicase-related protein [Clostridium gelidum]BCZ46149.1 DNA helicase [Clostridium gelidum]